MNDENPFSPAKLSAMREEIRRDGLLADKFLSADPDVPTFGLNLACAWPFPEAWREGYEQMARKFGAFGPEIYVYPFPFTHITLVTFFSFARHTNPSPGMLEFLQGKIPEVLKTIAPLFAKDSPERIKPFDLEPRTTVLSRAAGILPLINPDGEIAHLRRRVVELIQRNEPLHRELGGRGFNVPGIIHSTVMRFRQPPADLESFLASFDAIAGETVFPPVNVGEILLTSETKAYMRGGEILRRFSLAH